MARPRIIASFLALVLLAGTAAPSSAADRLTERLDRLLRGLHDEGAFNGAVVVTSRGKVVYARGFGPADAEAGVPFTPDTASDGGSLAKPVTAAAVLLLAAEGRIDLDAPVVRYVPEYPHPAATIRQLMSHSGGLPDYGAFQPLLDSGRPVSNADLLADVARRGVAPAFPPGSDFAYCNLCYDALALAVERVSGLSYQTFTRKRLLAPAGMTAGFVRPARFADWPGRRTRGYRWTPAGLEVFDALDNEGFYGGGNIYFTTRDLAAWTASWSQGSPLPPRARALALTTAQVGTGATGLTLGNWYCAAGGRRCYYTGHHQGFHNFAYWNAGRGLSIAMMTNNTLTAPLQMSLPRALIAVAEGRGAGTPQSELAARARQVAFSAAAGSYRAPGRRDVVIRVEGGRAKLRIGGGPTYRLFPTGWGRLYAPGLDASLSFADFREGAYHRVHWDSVFETWTAPRVRAARQPEPPATGAL